MKTRIILLAATSVLAVAACGGNGSDATVGRFIDGCLSSTNLERSFCECAAENAHEELSGDGFDFLVATFDDDEEAAAMLRTKLSPTEAIAAGMFMVTAYKKCASSGGEGRP